MSTVKIGWARREISTNEPVSIPGQMHIRVSKGIMDPLYVTALCVDGGQGQVVFLSWDVVAIGGDFKELLQETLAQQRPDISWDCVVFNVTHTHSSLALSETVEQTPDGVKIFPGTESMKIAAKLAVEAIAEAWDSRREGGIGYGYGYAVAGHSRRAVYFKEEKLAENAAGERNFMTPPGYAKMYGKTNDPLFSHYEAGADHFLNLMFTFDGCGKLTGMVVNVPCPSQVGGHLEVLSADYWTEVRQLVAEEFGPEVFVLPQCAAAGDLAPHMLQYRKAQVRRLSLKYGKAYEASQIKVNNEYYIHDVKARRMDIAEQIMAGIKDVYSWARKDIQTDVDVCCKAVTMELARRQVTDEEKAWCEENLQILAETEPTPEGLTDAEFRMKKSRHTTATNRNKRGITRYHEVRQDPTLETRCQIVRIGDIAFATTKFELYQDFMHRLQARSPFIQTFVVQMAGDSGSSYLATKRAIDGNGYSASMFCNAVDADGGQQWVENTLEILNEMKAKDAQ